MRAEPYLDDVVVALTDDDGDTVDEFRDPLAFYPTPVTRRCKPDAYGRDVVDVLPSL